MPPDTPRSDRAWRALPVRRRIKKASRAVVGLVGIIAVAMALAVASRPNRWSRHGLFIGIVTGAVIATLGSTCWFAFGLLGYRVTEEEIQAPKRAVYALLAVVVFLTFVVFFWLF